MSSFVVSGAYAQSHSITNASNTGKAPIAAMLDLPALGNTPEADRLLLREISDQHVFDGKQTAVITRRKTDGHSLDSLENFGQPPMPGGSSGTAYADPRSESSDIRAHSVQQIIDASSHSWHFVQQSTRLIIPDNDQINNYRKQYLQEAMWVSRILRRAAPFVGHIVEELDKRYLPVELALLPAIESGYQPDVQSAENAAGIWQIIPATAKEIGLERTQWFDGRADISASTTAAIDYLSYLNAEFHGDWLLTLAAYNAGPGRVRSAIKRNEKRNLPTDFWSLTLPRETRNYVPKFLALVAMLRYEQTPEFEIPKIKRGKGFEEVDVGQRVSLDKVAQFSRIDEKTLRLLNASLVHAVTPPSGPHTLVVPLGQGQALLDGLSEAGTAGVYTLPATHTVKAGDTLSSIARLYGISQRHLMGMNALENSLIKIGQTLAIRRSSTTKDTIEYVVTIGDTLSEIANRFAVNIDHIRNDEGEQLISDVIHPGVRLTIVLGAKDAS